MALTFLVGLLATHSLSILKMEAACSTEMLISTNKNTWGCNRCDQHLNTLPQWKPKYYTLYTCMMTNMKLLTYLCLGLHLQITNN